MTKNGRFDVREIQWRDNKTSIRDLTFRNVRRHAPSTTVARRPAAAAQSVDAAPDTRHIAAFAPDGHLAGTVRIVPLAGESVRREWDLGGMPPSFTVAEILGLSVADDACDTPISVELLTAAYIRARSLGCHALVARVWVEHAMMYEAMGFFRYHAGFNDPQRGFVIPMLLNLHDVAYLRLVESPLTQVAARYLNPDDYGPELLRRFAAVVAETRPPRSRGSADAAAETAAVRPPALDLDVDALVAVLGQAARQRLAVGTRLLAPDLPSDDVFIVVRGTLGVLAEGEVVPAFYLDAGDVIAETAFAREPAGLSIVTLTEATVVRMTRNELDRVVASDPALGVRVLRALVQGLSTRLARHLAQWRVDRRGDPETRRRKRARATALDVARDRGASR